MNFPMEPTDHFRFPAETTDENLAFCDMLDMWDAIAKGVLDITDTPEYALRTSAERNITVESLQGYMLRAKEIAVHYASLSK